MPLQLAGLPRLPSRADSGASISSASTGGTSSSSASTYSLPHLLASNSSLDDANFFPSVPDGIASSTHGGRTELTLQQQQEQQHGKHDGDAQHGDPSHAGLPEVLAESMIEGSGDVALEKILGAVGVLPTEGHGAGLQAPNAADAAPLPGGMGSLGGSVAWYGRPLAELHALAENLERRLKAFWTYR